LDGSVAEADEGGVRTALLTTNEIVLVRSANIPSVSRPAKNRWWICVPFNTLLFYAGVI
jgi:hypothetical protein